MEVYSRGEVRNHPSPGNGEGREGGTYADASVNALRASVIDKMSNHTTAFEQVVQLAIQKMIKGSSSTMRVAKDKVTDR